MKTRIYVLLLLTLFANTLSANPDTATTLSNSENLSPSSLNIQTFIDSAFVEQTLSLSIAFIESELKKLQSKPFRLSKAEIDALREDLYIRYHPLEIKKSLLIHLQNNIQNTQEGFAQWNNLQSSEFAKELSQARLEATSLDKTEHALSYQQELDLEAIQQHRLQISRTHDGLQKISSTQALMLQHIQDSIYERLNGKARSRYKIKDDAERLEEIRSFNQSLNLYAFRQFPAKEFIGFFNALASPEVQGALDAYELSLKQALGERESFDYLIENQ